ncbi:MAG: oligosaccharide flippase family protein [Pirellulales bacterium]|nr:oligosaccharide flippase family protein [Pirellulales bacterium]
MAVDSATIPRQRRTASVGVSAAGVCPSAESLRPLSMRRNFAWMLTGNVTFAACQWGVLVILAKLGSPEMVGQFVLGLAVTAPVIVFADLQLRGLQVTDARRQYSFRDYMALRLVTMALATAVILGMIVFGTFSREVCLLIAAIGAGKVFETISDTSYGALQQYERMDRIGRSLVSKGLLSLAAAGAGVLLTGSVLAAAVGLLIVRAGWLAFYDLPGVVWLHGGDVHSIVPRWNLHSMARLTWTAIPLGLASVMLSLNTNIPRYFVEHHLGGKQLGFFAAVAYVGVVGTTLARAMAQSAMPRLARDYVHGNRASFIRVFRRNVLASVAISAASVLVAAVAGRWILTLLYTPEYAEHADVFVVIAVAMGLQLVGAFVGAPIRATRRFRVLLAARVLSTTLLLALGWLLIRAHGMTGVAWAMVASAAAEIIVYAGITWSLLGQFGDRMQKERAAAQ